MKRILLITATVAVAVILLVAGASHIAPARESIRVGAELQGRVKAVRVQEGQSVRQGQILAILENDSYAAACASAVAQLKQKEAELRESEAAAPQRRQAEVEVAVARARVDQAYAAWYKTFVRAPVSGVVLRRHLNPGAIVTTPGVTPVITIAAVPQR